MVPQAVRQAALDGVTLTSLKRDDGDRPGMPLGDPRFARLLGAAAWERLPAAVRYRFSHRYGPGIAVTYVGKVVECRRSALGWVLTQLCRFIGAPLPRSSSSGLAAIVTVTEEPRGHGQVWTRLPLGARADTLGHGQSDHGRRFAPLPISEHIMNARSK